MIILDGCYFILYHNVSVNLFLVLSPDKLDGMVVMTTLKAIALTLLPTSKLCICKSVLKASRANMPYAGENNACAQFSYEVLTNSGLQLGFGICWMNFSY